MIPGVSSLQAPPVCPRAVPLGLVGTVQRAHFEPSDGRRRARLIAPKQAQTASGSAGVAVLLSRKKFGRVFRLADGKQLSTFEPNSLGNQ